MGNTYKDILVYVNENNSCSVKSGVAIELARAHGAHLTGLYVVPTVLPIFAEAPEFIALLQKQLEARALKAEARFRSAIDKARYPAQWLCVKGDPNQILGRYARHTDIVILTQDQEHKPLAGPRSIVSHVLLESGRPVLLILVNYARQPIGTRVLIAWNGSRESARAVADAMPMLKRAQSVEIVTVVAVSRSDKIDHSALCRYLAHHGVNVNAGHLLAREGNTGALLLAQATARNADLIVMGAYGYSRLREAVLGGVTRYVLDHATIPVLMAH